jgi:hypothetical protein
MMRSLLLALVIVFVSAAVTAGKELPLKAGDRVRIKAPGLEGIFVVENLEPGVLWMRDPGGIMPQRVRVEDISSLAIGVANTPLRGASQGAVFGAGAGFIIGMIVGLVAGDDESGSELSMDKGQAAMVLGGVLCAGGAFIGAIIGAIKPGERWESVPLDAQLDASAARNGTLKVGIAFSLRWP